MLETKPGEDPPPPSSRGPQQTHRLVRQGSWRAAARLPLIEGQMQMQRLIGMQKAAGVVPEASAEDEWCLSAAPLLLALSLGSSSRTPSNCFFPLKGCIY